MVSPGEHCKPTTAFIQALLPVVPVCMYVHFCSKTEEEMPSKSQEVLVFSALHPPQVVTVSGFSTPPPPPTV